MSLYNTDNDLVTTLEMPLLIFDYTGCDLEVKALLVYQPLVDAHAFLALYKQCRNIKVKTCLNWSLVGWVCCGKSLSI